MLKISIIIPTYNRAQLITRLIRQLLSQTQQVHEIIVVDDHSTDNTALLVKKISEEHPNVKYIINQGEHQRDGKKTGLKISEGDYIGFLDDDALMEDKEFIEKLTPKLSKNTVVQSKIILEQMGKKNLPSITLKDELARRPYPILELITTNLNRGTKPRSIFPVIEWGNFWHKDLAPLFIDNNLIKDAYGESYSASLKLMKSKVKLIMDPSLVLRHPGSKQGGSNKFFKKAMYHDFTEFHYGYFFNMIYIHSRSLPLWIWLWLPFYCLKSLVALAINKNLNGWWQYSVKPIAKSLKQNMINRKYVS